MSAKDCGFPQKICGFPCEEKGILKVKSLILELSMPFLTAKAINCGMLSNSKLSLIHFRSDSTVLGLIPSLAAISFTVLPSAVSLRISIAVE